MNPEALVGQFFHGNLDPNRDHQSDLGWQGQVSALVSPGLYEVQLFSWLDGDPTDLRLVRLSDMLACEWRFYSQEDYWVSLGAKSMDLDRECRREARKKAREELSDLSGPVRVVNREGT